MYRIKQRSYRIAEQIGVRIRASKKKGKKIDVIINERGRERIISIGQIGYYDYPTYLELEQVGKIEKGTALARKRAYEKRHKNDLKFKGTAGNYAYLLLWT